MNFSMNYTFISTLSRQTINLFDIRNFIWETTWYRNTKGHGKIYAQQGQSDIGIH